MPLALPPGSQSYIEGEYRELPESKVQKLKKKLADLKRKRAEQVEQKRVANVVSSREKLAESEKREEFARQKAESDVKLTEQKAKEREALALAHKAAQQRAQASADLRHEKFQNVKENITTFMKPITTLMKPLVYRVAQSGNVHFYSLGNKPQTLSPSYQALESAFNGESFSAQQAIQVVSVALQTSEQDAQRRLVLMKNYGFIKLEV